MRESEEASGENVTFLKRCWACDEPHVRPGRTCSRGCLSILAGFEDFTTLRSVLINARWAGAPSQEAMRKRYYRGRTRYGVRRLAYDAEALAVVLVEILEDLQEAEVGP